jgi:hypothetical protein
MVALRHHGAGKVEFTTTLYWQVGGVVGVDGCGKNTCSASTRSADASGRPSGRWASTFVASAVNVCWRPAAMCVSAAQNSDSSATLVRRLASEKLRLISVPRHLLPTT